MRTLPNLLGGLAGPPSAASRSGGRLDVVAAGPGNMPWRWWMDRSTWLGPAPLPIGSAGPANIPAEGLCLARSDPDRLELFAAGQGNTPWWWRAQGDLWSGPTPLPGGAQLLPVPVSAICAGPDSIEVFAPGIGNAPWWWRWDGRSWSSPMPLPPGGANIAAERLAAVSARPGRYDVFGAGSGNHLWHWWWENGRWTVEDLGGNLPREGVHAVSWGPERIDVFAAGVGAGHNPLLHWSWTGGGFSGVQELGGNLTAGSVVALSTQPGRLDVIGVSMDQRIARWQWDGRSWTGPQYRGNNVPSGDVAATLGAGSRLDVFVRGGDNTLRQWPGGGIADGTGEPWQTLAGNHGNPSSTTPALTGHLRPDSLEELVTIIQEAEKLGRTVRAVGSSWSNSDVGMTRDYLVETHKLDGLITRVLGADPAAVTAVGRTFFHVEAGMKLWELNKLLDSKGFALTALGGSSGQTLAGALSTGVHGANFVDGPVADMIRAIHLVGPGGIQHWIEPSSGITDKTVLAAVLDLAPDNIHYDDDWFNSALVSMGSMGIIYSLIVEVVPQYDLRAINEILQWDEMKLRLTTPGGPKDPFVGNRDVQAVIHPFRTRDGSRACFLTTRVALAEVTGAANPADPAVTTLTRILGAILPSRLNQEPGLIPDAVTFAYGMAIKPGTTRGWAHTISTSSDDPPAPALALEVGFDASGTGYLQYVEAVLAMLDKAFNDEHLGWGGWISLRFVGRSRGYLSPQNRWARTCMVEFAGVAALSSTQPLITRLETLAREHGGIQHWGMFDDLRASDVRKAYPHLQTWRRVRRELTRGGRRGTFESDFTRRCGLSLAPSVGDFSGDGRSDPVMWRPSDGTWSLGTGGAGRTRQWGEPGDMPVLGDFDGDGVADVAVWRRSNGTWYVIESSTGAVRIQQWGQPGDVPVPGDYNGDGRTDFAVWRPAMGNWFIFDSRTGSQRVQQWGEPNDRPVTGDFSGDGRTDIAVWRPSNGTWYVIDSSTGEVRTQQWGESTDVPVPGDYDGDGITDFAVWRPREGMWLSLDSSTGAVRSQQWGEPTDTPVPGDYDGDGRTDQAVFRRSNSTWHIIDSSTGVGRSLTWGETDTDIPVLRGR